MNFPGPAPLSLKQPACLFWLSLSVFFLAPVLPALAQDSFLQDFLNRVESSGQQLLEMTNDPSEYTTGPQSSGTAPDFIINQAAIERLKKAIARYEDMVRNHAWRPLKIKRPLKQGARGTPVRLLRLRLAATGDLAAPYNSATASEFDDSLYEAVVRFQTRHGIRNNGFVGRRTIAALNISARARLRQLRLNLRRLQGLLKYRHENRAVYVNIPAFSLYLVEKGKPVLQSRAITGRPSRRTPVLNARIRAVNILPTWRVPVSIARRDLYPMIFKDPDFFKRGKYRIYRTANGQPISAATARRERLRPSQLRFEQAPGGKNALGYIRIDMPNRESVYLHDTPLRKLFKLSSRSFSSGCVRVQRISDVVVWLLKSQKTWTHQKIRETIQAGKPVTISLSPTVPVHFIYVTAWVAPDHSVHFREDIYRKDGLGRTARFHPRTMPKQGIAP